jgi:hypothetical protein
VKHERVVLFLALTGSSLSSLFGQVNCPTNTATLPLVCEVPIAVAQVPTGGAAAISSATSASQAINSSIAAQLTQLPVPSGTSGAVLIQVKGNDIGIPYNNLGPILVDRPDTVGSGRLYVGFSYQHFNFNSIDGNSLGALPFAYMFSQPTTKPNTVVTGFGSQTSQVSFHLDQFVVLATYGATRSTDISVIVPINSVHLSSTTNAAAYLYTCTTGLPCSYGSPTTSNTSIAGAASGVGDVVFSVKQLIHGQEGGRTAISVGGSFRVPTGDQNNYLGSGAYGFNAFGLFSYRARLSPHLKLSEQWNGPSPLVQTASTNGEKNLPGGVQYDLGVDASVNKKITAAVDLLGSQFANTTSLVQASVNPPAAAALSPPASLPTVVGINNTYSTVNVSAGLKWKPIKDFLVYGNVLIQLNNVGLRSAPVPLAGISYNFDLRRLQK